MPGFFYDDRPILSALSTLERHIMAKLDELQAAVDRAITVEESAIALIEGLRQQIIDAGTDPAKLKEITDALSAESDKLAAGVAGSPASTAGTTPIGQASR